MATQKLVDLVDKYLQSLLRQYGFSFRQYWPNGSLGIGDMVEYTSEKYKMRFINDKSDVNVEIGLIAPDHPYHDLVVILSYIHKKQYPPYFADYSPYSPDSVPAQVESISKQLVQDASLIFTDDLLVTRESELIETWKKWLGIS
jgi:hypothetical protein